MIFSRRMIVLWEHPLSPYAQQVRIALGDMPALEPVIRGGADIVLDGMPQGTMRFAAELG